MWPACVHLSGFMRCLVDRTGWGDAGGWGPSGDEWPHCACLEKATTTGITISTSCSASSGQEIRFLAIRQLDLLLSSVSSPLFGSEELICLFVLSAAQCSALVNADNQTHECSLYGSVLCSMFIFSIYWGVQMFFKRKKTKNIKSACQILTFSKQFALKSFFLIVKSINQSITIGPKLQYHKNVNKDISQKKILWLIQIV